MKAFCLMTVGRCGSTALMQALRGFADIATPFKDISCADDELLHPKYVRAHASEYQQLTGRPVESPDQLMQAFYLHHADANYAGFKSMPNRHRHYEEFVTTAGLQFIGLTRRDIPSTVASFMLARATGCWRRDGGVQRQSLHFDPQQHGKSAASILVYVMRSIEAIRVIPEAINLTYEDLCREDFHSRHLDDFFGRAIRLENPRPPVHGSSYVGNWPEFLAFLHSVGEPIRNEPDP